MSNLKKIVILLSIVVISSIAYGQTEPYVRLKNGDVLYFEKVFSPSPMSEKIKCVKSNKEKVIILKIDVESAMVGRKDIPESLKQVVFVKFAPEGNILDASKGTISEGKKVFKVAFKNGKKSIIYHTSTERHQHGQPGGQRSVNQTSYTYVNHYYYVVNGTYKLIGGSMLYKNYKELIDDMLNSFSSCEKIKLLLNDYLLKKKKVLNINKLIEEMEKIYYEDCYQV